MLRLRPYKPCDGQAILSFIKDEETFYKWSAGKLGTFPLTVSHLNHRYSEDNFDCEPDNFYPCTAFDETGIVGHLTLRFTDREKQVIRFGLILVDDTKRGKGYGKEMLRLALSYAFDLLKAKKVTLGVFENNPSALACYRSVGFVVAGEAYDTIGNEQWKRLELEFSAPIRFKE